MISAADFSSEQQGKVTNLPPITKAPQRQVACVVCGQYFFKPQLPIHQRGCIRSKFQVSRHQSTSHSQRPITEPSRPAPPRYSASAQNGAPTTPSQPVISRWVKHVHDDDYAESYEPSVFSSAPAFPTPPIAPRHQSMTPDSVQLPRVVMDAGRTAQKNSSQRRIVTAPVRHVYATNSSSVDSRPDLTPPTIQPSHQVHHYPSVPEQRQRSHGPATVPPAAVETRVQCEICKRKFNQDAYDRHLNGCKKLNLKKRPVFDSVKSRATAELAQFQSTNSLLNLKKKDSPKAVDKPPTFEDEPIPTLKSSASGGPWRAKHETLVKAVRVAKSSHTKTYEQKSRFRAKQPDTASVGCPHCGRKFSDEAAERHMPICESNHLKYALKRKDDKTKKKEEALKRRMTFKPPLPGTMATRVEAEDPNGCNECGNHLGPKARFCAECGTPRQQ